MEIAGSVVSCLADLAFKYAGDDQNFQCIGTQILQCLKNCSLLIFIWNLNDNKLLIALEVNLVVCVRILSVVKNGFSLLRHQCVI